MAQTRLRCRCLRACLNGRYQDADRMERNVGLLESQANAGRKVVFGRFGGRRFHLHLHLRLCTQAEAEAGTEPYQDGSNGFEKENLAHA